MATLSDLAVYFEGLAITLPGELSHARTSQCALIILNDLLQVTPVDTSKAVSNWQISLNVPVTRTIPAYYVGEKGSSAISSRAAALNAAKGILATKKPGDVIYLGNALPYIRRLNDGHSNQAPAGFIDRAILLGRLFAKNPTNFATP